MNTLVNGTMGMSHQMLALKNWAEGWWSRDTDGFHFLSHFLLDDAARIFHMWCQFGEEGFTDSEILTMALSWSMEILSTCMDVTREWRDAALTMIHKFVPSTITGAIFLYYSQTISSLRAAVVVALGHVWAFRHYCEHQMGWLFARDDVQQIRQWLFDSDVLSYISSICVILAMIYLFLALRKSDDVSVRLDADVTPRTTTVGNEETSHSGQQSLSRGGTLINSINSLKSIAKTKTNASSTGNSSTPISKSPYVQLPPLELTSQTGVSTNGGTTNKMGTKIDAKSMEKNKSSSAASASFSSGGRGGGAGAGTPMSPEAASSIYADSRYSDNDSQGDSDVDASPAGDYCRPPHLHCYH